MKLSEETYNAIQEYLVTIDTNSIADDDRGTPLFLTKPKNGIRKRLSTKMIRTQIKDLLISIGYNSRAYSVHSLRHTFATTALLKERAFSRLKEALRHKNISTTQIYIRTWWKVSARIRINSFPMPYSSQRKDKKTND